MTAEAEKGGTRVWTETDLVTNLIDILQVFHNRASVMEKGTFVPYQTFDLQKSQT